MKPGGAKEAVDSILNEVQLLHRTDHPDLIELQDVTETVSGMLCMVPDRRKEASSLTR